MRYPFAWIAVLSHFSPEEFTSATPIMTKPRTTNWKTESGGQLQFIPDLCVYRQSKRRRSADCGSMKNLDNIELTKAQLVVAAAAQNAQQGVRNQPPINRRGPLAEEIDLEQAGVGFLDLQLKDLTKILGSRVKGIKVGIDIEIIMAMKEPDVEIETRTTGWKKNRATGEIEITDLGTIEEMLISTLRELNQVIMSLQPAKQLNLKWRKYWQDY
ncbi:hypothetical protein HAX54_012406 [Datura stramonium]|uniref:Uncharacterized protein n=1 Tax=Datura stramonium TaxID=4076 RepID=A0ABS8RXN2_DATST|nr:hypothetical protein [Datura stramonium]